MDPPAGVEQIQLMLVAVPAQPIARRQADLPEADHEVVDLLS